MKIVKTVLFLLAFTLLGAILASAGNPDDWNKKTVKWGFAVHPSATNR
jgi:hypothetical protein